MNRTDEQRKKTWAIIGEVVKQHFTWDGFLFDEYEWEQFFTALVRHEKVVSNPNQKGGKIIIGCREKQLTMEESSKMITLMEVFCAENGVALHEIEAR